MFWSTALRRLALGVAFAGVSAVASDESKLESGPLSLRIKSWTTDDGLPQNRVGSLKQTRDGYLWIGTWYGLARFDGWRFRTFDKFNTPEMANDTITALAEDLDGSLWVATHEGLLRYRGNRFQRLGAADGLPDLRVWRLASSSREGIWVQAGTSVSHFRRGHFFPVCNASSLPFGEIIALEEGRDGWLSVFTEAAWLEFSPEGNQARTNYVRTDVDARWWTARISGRPDEAWLGTESGLASLRKGDGRVSPIREFGSNRVDFVHEDRQGNLWMNARSPLFGRLKSQNWETNDLGGQLSGEATSMEQDLEGNTWLGTANGLVRLRTAPARSYTARDGLADNNAWSVCEGTDGTIWVGTDHGLSAITADGQVLNWRGSEPLPDYCDRCVWPNHEGGVWIAKQDEGIYEFQNGQFVKRFPYNSLPGLTTGLWEDSSGRLVVCTSAAVLLCRGNELDLTLYHDTTYAVREVRAVVESGDGTVWFATKGHGLARLNQGSLSFLTERDGLSNSNVWAIHRGQDGALWLATDNGLTRLLKGKFTTVTRRNGLLENTINCVLEDDLGFFWLSGLHGIYRIEAAQLRAVADGRAALLECHAFGTADGMESPETNGESQPAGCKARDGRLWFPTIRGVVVIDPKQINPREAPPQVVLEQVRANDALVLGDSQNEVVSGAVEAISEPSARRQQTAAGARIAPGQGKVLEFKYTANTFVAPERVRFRYRLVGADRDWREETSERTASYFNLRPGNYQFEVKAANHHNTWSTAPSRFPFSIAPRFWQTWSFYALCAGAVIGLAAAVQAYRLRWQRRLLKIEEQRALAMERTRIARDLHDDLGTALTGLALELDVIGRDSPGAPRLSSRLNEAARRVRELAERMREVVWSVNPRCDTVSSLADFLEQQVSQFLRGSGVVVRLEFPEDIPPLPIAAEARHQLALSVREALTNIVRHAGATEVVLSLSISGGTLTVQIKDNGRGFEPAPSPGQGLDNMRARLEQAGGIFEFASRRGGGTVLNFRLPLDMAASVNHDSNHR
jgi:signal transduction histidine kinase/ligand-binding sensor domain-containing protein